MSMSYGEMQMAMADTPASDLYLVTSDNTQPDWYTMLMPGDQFDVAKMQGAQADQSQPWWQSMIQTGLTRIIDNTTAPTNVAGNTNPGSFAGANGRTYPQDVAKTNVQAHVQDNGMGMLLLLGLAFILVK